jgi:hypothetical protein
MSLQDYIKSVCAANSLEETALHFLQTSDPVYHADRHVAEPPQGLGVEAACSAGLALLANWTREASAVERLGLVASKPLLVVDQEWLDELPDAPPPHVLVTLARCSTDLPPEVMNAKRVAQAACPLGNVLVGDVESATVFKIAASEERESLGGWLFRLDAAPTPDSSPQAPRG